MKTAIELTIAVIGLGKMGAGMAANIQASGAKLIVYNRTVAKADAFVQSGAMRAATPKDAASKADIVLTSLMDDVSVKAIISAPEGILAGLRPGTIHLCTTTISPEMAEELTELHRRHGSYFVSGTVVGRPDSAAAGELLTLLSGDEGATARCMSVCDSYSAKVIPLGTRPGLANYAKLSINYFAVATMDLMGQIYAYGDAIGIDRAFYCRLFEGSFSNPALKLYAAKIRDRAFDTGVGFELPAGLKDVKMMADASDQTSGSFAFAPGIIAKMEQAIEHGRAHSDWSVFTDMPG